jgi:hypothetical protein
MVSPFNATPSYNFRGTCELIALTSCSGEESAFAVRVDFIGHSVSNGAVGVYINGLRWISREDGSFFSDIEGSSPTDPNILEYPANDIQVMLNEAGMRTEIAVGGSIQVTVVHVYGGECALN